MNKIDIIYIYLFILIIIFFLYGLILSEIIDYIFPVYNKDIHDFRITLEIFGEIGIAYIIYFIFQYYSDNFIKLLYTKISTNPPIYLNKLLLIAFSMGIFKHLQKSKNKIVHIQERYLPNSINYIMNILNNKK
jgi:hypothetical protein